MRLRRAGAVHCKRNAYHCKTLDCGKGCIEANYTRIEAVRMVIWIRNVTLEITIITPPLEPLLTLVVFLEDSYKAL